jgi:hypothetical protein
VAGGRRRLQDRRARLSRTGLDGIAKRWSSSSPNAIGTRHRPRFAHDHIVALHVAFADVAVRDRVKQAGGTWNPERRVWQLRYDRVVALGLTGRIVAEPRIQWWMPGAERRASSADAPTLSRYRCLHLPLDARDLVEDDGVAAE